MGLTVRGNASDARNLRKGILNDANTIVANTKKLNSACEMIKSAWKDRGVTELEGIVNDLANTLRSHASGVNNTCAVLEEYAKFLEDI